MYSKIFSCSWLPKQTVTQNGTSNPRAELIQITCNGNHHSNESYWNCGQAFIDHLSSLVNCHKLQCKALKASDHSTCHYIHSGSKESAYRFRKLPFQPYKLGTFSEYSVQPELINEKPSAGNGEGFCSKYSNIL